MAHYDGMREAHETDRAMREAASTAPQTPPTLEGVALPGGWRFEPLPWPNGDERDAEDMVFDLVTPEGDLMGQEWEAGDAQAFAAALSRSAAVAQGVPAGVVRRPPAAYFHSGKEAGFRAALSAIDSFEADHSVNTPTARRSRDAMRQRVQARLDDLLDADQDDAALVPDAKAGAVGSIRPTQRVVDKAWDCVEAYSDMDGETWCGVAARIELQGALRRLLQDRLAASGAAPAGGLPGDLSPGLEEAIRVVDEFLDDCRVRARFGAGMVKELLTARLSAAGTGDAGRDIALTPPATPATAPAQAPAATGLREAAEAVETCLHDCTQWDPECPHARRALDQVKALAAATDGGGATHLGLWLLRGSKEDGYLDPQGWTDSAAEATGWTTREAAEIMQADCEREGITVEVVWAETERRPAPPTSATEA